MSLLDTIAALHAELDAHPDAHDTRRILADALEEAGGEWEQMAEGYRALGLLQVRPFVCDRREELPSDDEAAGRRHFYGRVGSGRRDYPGCLLPDDWFEVLDGMSLRGATHPEIRGSSWVWYEGRRAIERAAALAFSKLPPDRRAELLAGNREPALATGKE